MSKTAACLLLLLLGVLTVDARSRRKSHANGGTPGEFDYYLLTLSWAPDFCARPDVQKNSRECGTGNHVGFVVHGMWPQFENGGYPSQCAPARPVAQDIVNRTLAFIPDAGLIQHEWRDHGTCSGLSPAEYFDAIGRAFSNLTIPPDLKNLNHQIQVSPQEIESKFAAANRALPPDSIRVACGGGELSDVRICLTKDLKGRACTVKDCPASAVTMLPVR